MRPGEVNRCQSLRRDTHLHFAHAGGEPGRPEDQTAVDVIEQAAVACGLNSSFSAGGTWPSASTAPCGGRWPSTANNELQSQLVPSSSFDSQWADPDILPPRTDNILALSLGETAADALIMHRRLVNGTRLLPPARRLAALAQPRHTPPNQFVARVAKFTASTTEQGLAASMLQGRFVRGRTTRTPRARPSHSLRRKPS
jgi:hypothetical protein